MRKHFTILLAALAAITLGVVGGTASEAVDTDTPTVEAIGASTGYMGTADYWNDDDMLMYCAGRIDHWGSYNHHSHTCLGVGVSWIRYPGQSAHCYYRFWKNARFKPFQDPDGLWVRQWTSPLYYGC